MRAFISSHLRLFERAGAGFDSLWHGSRYVKAGTDRKLKFTLLQRELGLERWQVVGILQSIWTFAGENCPSGDIGRFSDEEIGVGIDYRGDPNALVDALVKHRWLDRDDECRLIIHDWAEHCEEWVRKRAKRSGLTLARPARRPASSSSSRGCENGGRAADARRTRGTKNETRGSLPIPSHPSQSNPSRTTREVDDDGDWRTEAARLKGGPLMASHGDYGFVIAVRDDLEAEPVEIGGQPVDALEFFRRLVDVMKLQGFVWSGERGARSYAVKVIQRCRGEKCWPGEWPDDDSERGKPRVV